ncbi:helix-turn-helix domain-containing protein, partial [Kamptonema animale CS-326]
MILSYKYKLPPTNHQSDKLSDWLNMLRAAYNWSLKD